MEQKGWLVRVAALLAATCLAAACTPPPQAPAAIAEGALDGVAKSAPMSEPEALPPFAVASDCAPATRAAVAILEAGGSAADAAVAAMLAAGVVHPSASGLGGGGFALWRDEGGPRALDFRVQAPKGLSSRHAHPPPGSPRRSAIGVPGELAGLATIHRHGGRLSWRALFEPALSLAREGFVVSAYLARAMRHARPWLRKSALAEVLAPGGSLLEAGAKSGPWPALAVTLEHLAAEGPEAFYGGQIGVSLAQAMAETWSEDDLGAYRAEPAEALRSHFAGSEIFAPPSHGGLVLTQLLRLYQAERWQALETVDRAHLFVEALGAARTRALRQADPATLLAPGAIDALRAELEAAERKGAAGGLDDGGTTNVLVIDEEGRAVTISSSLGSPFGAQVIASGVVLNDQLSAFLRPHEVRRFGARHAPRPGARPPSNLTPLIVAREDEVASLLSASGGQHIPGALSQVLFALLVDGRAAGEAVAAPRLRVPAEGGIWLEAPSPLAQALRSRGHHVRSDLPGFEAVQVIQRADGRFAAAVDARKGGAIGVR